MNIDETETSIVNVFSEVEEPMERYDLLIELGQQLKTLSQEFYKDEFLVKGCQSKVWLVAENRNGTIELFGDSNTAITKGLVYILVNILSERKVDEILNWEPEIMNKLGLHQMLTSQRANGFLSIVQRIKEWAKLFKEVES